MYISSVDVVDSVALHYTYVIRQQDECEWKRGHMSNCIVVWIMRSTVLSSKCASAYGAP